MAQLARDFGTQFYYWLRLLGWNLVERAHTAFCSCGRLG